MNNDYYNISKIPNYRDHIEGEISWQSPSNIALIKYWGKSAGQIPLNPSISFTLDQAHTKTSIHYRRRVGQEDWLRFTFEGSEAPSFSARIKSYLDSLRAIFPFIDLLAFDISSENSFPHSSGIASSASSMSALALCLCSIERDLSDQNIDQTDFLRKASFVARLGSGSACRSVYQTLAIWGEVAGQPSSDLHVAIPYMDCAPIFRDYHDDILIISGEKKSVSSTAGHKLMDTNPFAQTRYDQARTNLQRILATLQSGDLEEFIEIVEEEALTLHALMMCSRPSYTLMKPNTLAAIERIRDFRRETHIPVAFTLDAGPNIHLIYPHDYVEAVQDFTAVQLLPLTESGLIIKDQVGQGPTKLK